MVLEGNLAAELISLMMKNGTTTSRTDVENFQAQSPDADFFTKNVLDVIKEKAGEVVIGKKYNLYQQAGKTTRPAADTDYDLDALFIELTKDENAVALGAATGGADTEPAAINTAVITGVKAGAITNLSAVLIKIIGTFHNDSSANIAFNTAKVSDATALPRTAASTARTFLFALALILSNTSAWKDAQKAIPLVAANLTPVFRGIDNQVLTPINVGGTVKYYSFPSTVTPSVANVGSGTAGAPLTVEFTGGPNSAAATLATAAYSIDMHKFIVANLATTMKKVHARNGFSQATPNKANALLAALFYGGRAATQNDLDAWTNAEQDTDAATVTTDEGKWSLATFTPVATAASGAGWFNNGAAGNGQTINNAALAGSHTVMRYIRNSTANAATYQTWDSLLLAANSGLGDSIITGSIVAYRNTNLYLFALFLKLAEEQGVSWTRSEYETMTTAAGAAGQAGNYGKLNSNTGAITAQTATDTVTSLVPTMVTRYNEYAIFSSQTDITPEAIVKFLRAAAGSTNPNNNVTNTIVTNFITNSIDKATKDHMLANPGIMVSALRTIFAAKESPSADTEEVYIQKLMNGGAAYAINGAASTLGYTLNASVLTDLAELKLLLRTGTTYRGSGILDFTWGPSKLASLVNSGFFKVNPGSLTTSGLYDLGPAGDFLNAKDHIALDSSSMLLSGVDSAGTALTNTQKIAQVFKAYDAIKTALGAGGASLRSILFKTSTTKTDFPIGEVRLIATTIAGADVLNANPTMANMDLIDDALSARSDSESLKDQWAFAKGSAGAASVYGAANTSAASLYTMYTAAHNTTGFTTYSQEMKDKIAKAMFEATWSMRNNIAGGNVAATASQQANKRGISEMVNFLDVIINNTALRDLHDAATERANLVHTVRLHAQGEAFAIVPVTTAGKTQFNDMFLQFIKASNNSSPGFDFTDKDGAAIANLTAHLAKATAAMTASVASVVGEVLTHAFTNPAFDLNKATIDTIAANNNLLSVSAYLVGRGLSQDDPNPESKYLNNEEINVLVQAGLALSELKKMVYVDFGVNGYVVNSTPTKYVLVKREHYS
jgi:hypothetical protein